LNLLDFAWSTVEFITNKSPSEIKVLIDQSDYPFLEQGPAGSIIHVSPPKGLDENFSVLYAMHFDNDPPGRSSLWRMFRASLCHLSLHAYGSNFETYAGLLAKENNNGNATFAMSLAEDYAIRSMMKTLWPGLLLETAKVNHQVSLCFNRSLRETDLAARVAANFLSYYLVGENLVSLGRSLDEKIAAVHSDLLTFSKKLYEIYDASSDFSDKRLNITRESEIANNLRLQAASNILSVFKENHIRLSFVPCIPYTEHYGKQNYSLFGDPVSTMDEISPTLLDALGEVSLSKENQLPNENEWATRSEAETVLSAFEYSQSLRKRITDNYKKQPSHFESFGFPTEDFAEFVRIKSRLAGRIRCALDLLRMAKTSIDELRGQEYGFVDVPLAIQVIASKSSRNDVYFRDEPDSKNESWAILIDSSKSLQRLVCEVRDAAVCLAEIANGMLAGPESWACYTFNENFNIIKDFSERYSNEIRARVGGIGSGLKTYLPDAISLAAARLQQTQSDLKVIVVVSDGYPQGYEGIDEELVQVIENVNKTGIVLIGIGVQSTAISKYFRTTMVAHNAYELMKDFVNVYYEIVGSSV
jgi:hypothetical protein